MNASEPSVDLAMLQHMETLLAAAEEEISNLKIALQSARLIGAALGILMATRKLDWTRHSTC